MGHKICAVAMNLGKTYTQKDTKFPIQFEDQLSLEYLARQNQIPVINLNQDSVKKAFEMSSHHADAIIVSCYPKKIAKNILSIPRIGCFNLHPTLLPAYRGPSPLFWQYRDGCRQFGITLHCMSSELDSGDIVGQSSTSLTDGISIKQAEKILAKLGANLLESSLDKIAAGLLSTYTQDKNKASYQSFPTQTDYTVSVNWTAKRLYNFMSATRQHGITYQCLINGENYKLLKAYDYANQNIAKMVIKGNMITLPCSQGYVIAQIRIK